MAKMILRYIIISVFFLQAILLFGQRITSGTEITGLFDNPVDSTDGAQYLIITFDVLEVVAKLEELRNFRQDQGILTRVETTTTIGGASVEVIGNYIKNAYFTWDIPPLAVLLVGDADKIPSPPYPGNKNDISDNFYADMDFDDLPDLAISRLPINNPALIMQFIDRLIDYESSPPENPEYYLKPVTSLGWIDGSDQMICAESVLGYFENILEKEPIRENAIESGIPGSDWTCSPSLLNYFGPSGLGYVPDNASYLTDWGGNAERINDDLNAGSFLILNLDSGTEYGWAHPEYWTSDLLGLNQADPFFVISINTLNGKFNWSFDCFAEAIIKHPQGSMGVIASSHYVYSEPSQYFFLYIIDGLWESFMPDVETNFSPFGWSLPAFSATSAKHILATTALPNKESVYYGFHYFGEPFCPVVYNQPEIPEVIHVGTFNENDNTFDVQANEGMLIALTVNHEILATGIANGSVQNFTTPPLSCSDTLTISVTGQNYLRYSGIAVCDGSIGFTENTLLISDISISPNPANDFISVILSEDNDQLPIGYSIFSTDGLKVLGGEFYSSKNNIYIGELKPGCYFLELEQNTKYRFAKFVVLDI